MKKKLLISAIAIFALFNANAQEKGKFELGGGFGLNIANVSKFDGNDNVNATSRISFNAGASGEYYFSDRWGLKAKLIFDSKGYGDGRLPDFNNLITNFRLNYITVPLMANWHFGSKRNWYLNFGSYVGFLVSAKDSRLGLNLKNSTSLKFSNIDFGLAAGIGYKFEVKDNVKLYVEYDGQAGLIDIFDFFDNDTITNGRSSINIGVLFTL